MQRETPEVTASLFERLVKELRDFDQLAYALPSALAGSKLSSFGELAHQLTRQSQALRLAVSLNRPVDEVRKDARELLFRSRHLDALSSKSRIDAQTRLMVRLLAGLAQSIDTALKASSQ